MGKETLQTTGQFATNKELASSAGKKSAQVKKEQKAMRQIIIECLNAKTPDAQIAELKEHFPDLPDDASNFITMTHAAMKVASKGDVKAFKILSELAGVLEQNINLNSNGIPANNTITVNIIKPDKEPDESQE